MLPKIFTSLILVTLDILLLARQTPAVTMRFLKCHLFSMKESTCLHTTFP